MKSPVSPVEQPPREDVFAKLEELMTGRISRETAAAWASHWLAEDHGPGRDVRVTDLAAWTALTSMAGADSHGGDRPYLYDEEDFAAWRDQLSASPG